MSRKVTIFCDGGLGNRLGTLVGGLVFAEQLDATPVVCWPVNNWCGCNFTDLFDADIESTEHNIFELFTSQQNNIFLIHENQTTLTLSTVFGHNASSLDTICNLEADVVYYHNKIDPQFDRSSIIRATETLTIKKSILNTVNEFIEQNGISQTTIGLHLRKTDMVGLNDDDYYDKVVANPNSKFFICSDNGDTEKRFADLPNVYIFPKTSYAKKMIEGAWRTTDIVDTDGRPTKYNVTRDKQSVLEAFSDMLILSRTYIQPTIKSSFSLFSKIYAEISELPCQG
jgi:hypothetical protein